MMISHNKETARFSDVRCYVLTEVNVVDNSYHAEEYKWQYV